MNVTCPGTISISYQVLLEEIRVKVEVNTHYRKEHNKEDGEIIVHES